MNASRPDIAVRLARTLRAAFCNEDLSPETRPETLALGALLCTDTRRLRPGEVFWALRGQQHDGHWFLREAAAAGAAAVVIEAASLRERTAVATGGSVVDWGIGGCEGNGGARRGGPNAVSGRDAIDHGAADARVDGHAPVRCVTVTVGGVPDPNVCSRTVPAVVVADTLRALQVLAGWWRRQHRQSRVVAVTGSVAKTSTRAMTAAILERIAPCVQSPESFNNHIGVPLSLLRLCDHAFGVFEAGTSAPGEIAALARTIRPTAAILTPVGAAHLRGLRTLQGVREEKAALLAALPAGAAVVLPADSPFFLERARSLGLRVLTVGDARGASWRPTDLRQTHSGIEFRLAAVRFRLPVAGRHWALAAASATAMAVEHGATVTQAAEALADFRPQPGRGRVFRTERWTWIDDSYNANPLSMRAGLSTLAEWPVGGLRVAVLGEMLDLGAAARRQHAALGRWAAELPIDRFVCLGERMRYFVAALESAGGRGRAVWARSFDELTGRLGEILADPRGGAVLVKGSRAMRMESVLPRGAAGVAADQAC